MSESTANKGRGAAGAGHKCKTCGQKTTDRGHMCSPQVPGKVVACVHCGEVHADHRQVCVPMLQELKYQCSKCGRLSVVRSDLCRPELLLDPAGKK